MTKEENWEKLQENAEIITISEEKFQRLLDILENPPKISEKLKKAVENYVNAIRK